MRRITKWLLILGLGGSTTTVFSCSGDFWQEMRDAAFDGAAAFVTDATFTLLGDNIGTLTD